MDIVTQAREYIGTFVTEFSVLACQLLTYKLAAHLLGAQGFSEYAVARRTIALIYPVCLLGLGVALPRYIAHAAATKGATSSGRYFGAAVWCVGVGLLLCVLLMNLFPGYCAYLFFGNKSYGNLIFPMTLLLIGLTLHATVYAYFRGCLIMKWANILQFINLAIMPLLAFLVFGKSLRTVLSGLGIFDICTSGICLFFIPMRYAREAILPEVKELLSYGIQRVPGDFIQMALFTFPVIFIAHTKGVKEAGFVAFSVSVLSMIGSVFSPVGLVLLPRASKMLAEGAYAELRSHILRIAVITFIVASGLTIFFEFFAKVLIHLYLGSAFNEVAVLIRIVSLGALPFALYCVLRSLIDAYYFKAINMINNGIAFLVFLLLSGFLLLIHAPFTMLLAFLIAIFILGLLTIGEAWKILSKTKHTYAH